MGDQMLDSSVENEFISLHWLNSFSFIKSSSLKRSSFDDKKKPLQTFELKIRTSRNRKLIFYTREVSRANCLHGNWRVKKVHNSSSCYNWRCQTHSCSIMFTFFLLARALRVILQAWNISETWAKLFYRFENENFCTKGKSNLSGFASLPRQLATAHVHLSNYNPWLIFNNENPFENDLIAWRHKLHFINPLLFFLYLNRYRPQRLEEHALRVAAHSPSAESKVSASHSWISKWFHPKLLSHF